MRVWFERRLKRRGKNNGLTTVKGTMDVYKVEWELGERVDKYLLGSTIPNIEYIKFRSCLIHSVPGQWGRWWESQRKCLESAWGT